MGIALRPGGPEFGIVESYYKHARREPTLRGDLAISKIITYKPNFLDLVRMLDAKQQSHVVVVSHGSTDGLLLPLSDHTSDDADSASLVDLLVLVEQHPDLDAALVASFASGYNMPQSQVRELARLCHKVRVHAANCIAVHIRGCRLGANAINLEIIRRLFGSQVVTAPTCPMLYAPFEPEWSRPQDKNIDTWKSAHSPDTRRREFSTPSGTLVMDINESGASSSTQGVIQHADDLAKWATDVYGHSGHAVAHSMPIAAMWADDTYHLPHEPGYTFQLQSAVPGMSMSPNVGTHHQGGWKR